MCTGHWNRSRRRKCSPRGLTRRLKGIFNRWFPCLNSCISRPAELWWNHDWRLCTQLDRAHTLSPERRAIWAPCDGEGSLRELVRARARSRNCWQQIRPHPKRVKPPQASLQRFGLLELRVVQWIRHQIANLFSVKIAQKVKLIMRGDLPWLSDPSGYFITILCLFLRFLLLLGFTGDSS